MPTPNSSEVATAVQSWRDNPPAVQGQIIQLQTSELPTWPPTSRAKGCLAYFVDAPNGQIVAYFWDVPSQAWCDLTTFEIAS